MNYSYVMTPQSITVVDPSGNVTTLAFDNVSADRKQDIISAIQSSDWEEVISLMTTPESVEDTPVASIEDVIALAEDARFSIKDGVVLFQGSELPEVLSERITNFIQMGLPIQPLLRFFTLLQQNPSRNSVQQLYKFLEHRSMPIDDNGHFLAYKGVRDDYMDCHTGTFSNVPGTTHSVPRNQVDDDPNVGCSYGFHVGSLAYARSFGVRCVIVRVNPAHVVAVPHDCNFQKMRTCEYTVMCDYVAPLTDNYAYENETEEEADWDFWDSDDYFATVYGDEDVNDEEEELLEEIDSLQNRIDDLQDLLDNYKNRNS